MMWKLGGFFFLMVIGLDTRTHVLGDLVKDFTGYKLIQVQPSTKHHVDILRTMAEKYPNLDFWTEPSVSRPVDINISPDEYDEITELLLKEDLSPTILQSDVQKFIEEVQSGASLNERSRRRRAAPEPSGPPEVVNRSIVNTFARHGQINEFLTELESAYPDLVLTYDIGTTYQGRIQKVIKIGKPSAEGLKPVIWVDANIHAREWITAATTIWIIDYLLLNYETDNVTTRALDQFDWHFLPVANPDGYEHTHTTNRLWRKTMMPTDHPTCIGVDPNRNWDYDFYGDGSSTDRCSLRYRGPAPFSEPCVDNMQKAIKALTPRMKFYMAIHCYSQMWLTPWGCCYEKPADYPELLRVAEIGNKALEERHNKTFILGTPADILYTVSGGAYDWVKGKAGVKYVYSLELRPLYNGSANKGYGFIVPTEEITPSGEEVWAGLSAMALAWPSPDSTAGGVGAASSVNFSVWCLVTIIANGLWQV